jgi:hypothetical protein
MQLSLAWCISVALFLIGCTEQASTSLTNSASAAANEPSSALKSSCDAAGAKWFKENYPLPDEQSKASSGRATYTFHYSASLKRCYLESVAVAHIDKDANSPVSGDSEIHQVIDLEAGKEIGQFVMVSTANAPLMCQVDDVKCATLVDWTALAARYMKN